MKTSLILTILILGIHTFAIAGNDKAVGSCKLQLKRNKTKHGELRKSLVEYTDMEIKPLTRFPMYGEFKRVYVNPEDKAKIHRNTVVLFEEDLDKLNDFDNPTVVVDGPRKGDIEIEYVQKGAQFKTGRNYRKTVYGPALRIHHMDGQGKIHEKVVELHDGEQTFTYKSDIKVRRTRLESNENPVAIASSLQNRRMKLKCTFNVKETPVTTTTRSTANLDNPDSNVGSITE